MRSIGTVRSPPRLGLERQEVVQRRHDFLALEPEPPDGERPVPIDRIDHITLAQPFEAFDEAGLFYRSLLDLEGAAAAELAAPHGLVRSRALASADRRARIGSTCRRWRARSAARPSCSTWRSPAATRSPPRGRCASAGRRSSRSRTTTTTTSPPATRSMRGCSTPCASSASCTTAAPTASSCTSTAPTSRAGSSSRCSSGAGATTATAPPTRRADGGAAARHHRARRSALVTTIARRARSREPAARPGCARSAGAACGSGSSRPRRAGASPHRP